MLYEVMKSIKNFFPVKNAILEGEATIKDGTITLDSVQDGQYFLIEGSVFNDGVYCYPASNLVDETFEGFIVPLAIPHDFMLLVKEIEEWQEKNGNATPYTSESFGGYTYSKGTTASGNATSWQNAFAGRLNAWRKM